MKTNVLYALMLLASFSLFSCDKDKETTTTEPTTVSIGGKAYPIAKIGTQTWTTVNYSGNGGVYFNPAASNENYGKLYTLAEAKGITLPAGWRLPTKEDYVKLLESQGASFVDGKSTSLDPIKKILSTSGWAGGVQGTNTSNFNALPAGYYISFPDQEGTLTIFWTSSVTAGNNPYFFVVNNNQVLVETDVNTTQRFSIRFVKE